MSKKITLPTSNWHPSIRKRMNELGLHGMEDLWERIQPLLDTHRSFFGPLSQYKLNSILDKSSDHFYDRKTGEYYPATYAIALALETNPVDLFGEVPEMKPSKTPFMLPYAGENILKTSRI